LYDLNSYQFRRLDDTKHVVIYDRWLSATYRRLRFLNDRSASFMPRSGTERYGLFLGERLVAICALTPVSERQSVFHRSLPYPVRDGKQPSYLELNNVLCSQRFPGVLGLTLLLYYAVMKAQEAGFTAIVGIAHYEALRQLADLGATPVLHDPLHILGRDDLFDFVVYYDLSRMESSVYIYERTVRSLHAMAVMNEITSRYISTRRAAKPQAYTQSPRVLARSGGASGVPPSIGAADQNA
jgi:hypothetical protein